MQSRRGGLVVVSLALVVVAGLSQRLKYGIEFSDEPFYIALAYRFVLGDQPFLDELHLSQSAALILVPFVKLYLAAVGDSEGIVLFVRRLFLLMTCGVMAGVFLALRRFLAWPIALLISMICIALVPFLIPSLSYNTLGSNFFTLGVFIGWIALDRPATARELPLLTLSVGLVHGLAVLAYPPLLVPVTLYAGIVAARVVRERPSALAAHALGGVAIGAVVVSIAGIDGFARVYEFMHNTYMPDDTKLAGILEEAWALVPRPELLAVAFGVGIWQARSRPLVACLALLPLPAIIAWHVPSKWYWMAPLEYTTLCSLLGLGLLPLVWHLPLARKLFVRAYLPSLTAGLTFAWASSNGFINTGLGLVPALIVTAIFFYLGIREAADRAGIAWLREVGLAATCVIVGVLLGYLRHCYGAPPLKAHREFVASGPYAGMYGTPARTSYLAELQRDLSRVANDRGRILFYDHYPAGYLMTKMRPATPSIFTCYKLIRAKDPELCGRYFEEVLDDYSVAIKVPWFRMVGRYGGLEIPMDPSIKRLVFSRMVLDAERIDVMQRPMFRIHVGRGLTAASPTQPNPREQRK